MNSSDRQRFWKETVPKFLEAAAIWTIVAGVIGWLSWKEINRRPIPEEAGREVIFTAGDSHGVTDGSALICQGIQVGKITGVSPAPRPGDRLQIEMTGSIDAKFKDWDFAPQAATKAGALTAGITGTPIVLTYRGELPAEERTSPQTFVLEPPEDTGRRVSQLLGEVTKITTAFTDPVPPSQLPPDWPADASPMRIAVIVHNLERATATLKQAAVTLEHELDVTDDATLLAGLRGIKGNVDTLTAEVAEVLDTLDNSLASIDGKVTDIVGRNAEERSAPRRELTAAIARADELLERLNLLIPRVGDTFLGRMVIRKAADDEEQP
jgi:ABC-type transporter Mla subunit MlaD